jgi:hypothetical protein
LGDTGGVFAARASRQQQLSALLAEHLDVRVDLGPRAAIT